MRGNPLSAVVVACVCLGGAGAAWGEVVGRYIFYNNSAFDNNDPAVNSDDDAAIAPDKQALSGGQAARYANYTTYSHGINGIAIDVTGLNGVPTAADFEFRRGNDNEPWKWHAAPTTQVTVRAGAGTGGCDRVVLTWPDQIIRNEWLQVRMLPTTVTGLSAPDVFYFGNSVGDSGNSTTDAYVSAIDALAVINYLNINGVHAVDIDFMYDHNRDGWISALDSMIIIDSINGGWASTLELIRAPWSPDGPATPPDSDAWTEYPTGILAKQDGWDNTCGLSQRIIASTDCVTGLYSVGCEAIQARWDKPFEFAKAADIRRARELRFEHRDSWSARNVQLRIYMGPTPAEQAMGIVEKKVDFNYQTATSWTPFSGVLEDGQWSWKDANESWLMSGGNMECTMLIRIEWFHYAFPWITPVAIGDTMLIDRMHFVMSPRDGPFRLADLAAFAANWLRDDCDLVNGHCEGSDVNTNGRVDFEDYAILIHKGP